MSKAAFKAIGFYTMCGVLAVAAYIGFWGTILLGLWKWYEILFGGGL